MRTTAVLSALLLSTALTACARVGRGKGPAPADSAVLEVRNDYAAPVVVYAVREGTSFRIRLGEVFGSSDGRFKLGPSVIGGAGNVAFVAQPPTAAGTARTSSGIIAVRPGNVVQFRISTSLVSTAFIR